MAYTIDLISVLKSLFDNTLKPDLVGTTNWEVLEEAFGNYERSNKRRKMYAPRRPLYASNNRVLTRDPFRWIVERLPDESLGLETVWVEVGMSVV